MALTTKLSIELAATLTSALDLSTGRDALSYQKSLSLSDGSAADQADLLWHDQRTLTASATENLDLAGSLTDAFGTTLTFDMLKMIVVFAAAANTNNVEVTRPGSNGVGLFLAAGDGIAVRPGGIFVAGALDGTAYDVTAGTGDILTFTNSAGGTSGTYGVVLVGAT